MTAEHMKDMNNVVITKAGVTFAVLKDGNESTNA